MFYSIILLVAKSFFLSIEIGVENRNVVTTFNLLQSLRNSEIW